MFLLILTVLLKKRNVLAQKSLATNQYLYSFIIYLTYKIKKLYRNTLFKIGKIRKARKAGSVNNFV
ncbi:hypothetical protein CWE29_02485 [Enterococcus faecium]|nr:hypothetical protein CWE29_02485 [Enterococcus faecium]